MATNPLDEEHERGWGRDPAGKSRVLECTGSWEQQFSVSPVCLG